MALGGDKRDNADTKEKQCSHYSTEHSHKTHSDLIATLKSLTPHACEVSSNPLINSTRPCHITNQKGATGVPSHKLRGATAISAEACGKPLNISGKRSGRKPRTSLETREGSH